MDGDWEEVSIPFLQPPYPHLLQIILKAQQVGQPHRPWTSMN